MVEEGYWEGEHNADWSEEGRVQGEGVGEHLVDIQHQQRPKASGKGGIVAQEGELI